MKIKYDKTEQKIYKIVGIISAIAFLLSILEVILELPLPTVWIAIFAMMLFVSVPVGIMAGFGYLECRLYFKELEKYGIEPPLHKNDPNEIHRITVMMEQKMQAEYTRARQNGSAPDTGYNKASAVLAAIAFSISAGALVWVFWYTLHFARLGMGGEVSFLVLVALLGAFLWSVGGTVYWKQRSNEKYKNDGDPTPGKKVRSGPAKGILTMLIMLCITFFAYHTIYEMSKYVYYSKLQVIFGSNWGIHKGERVDTDYNQFVIDEWNAHHSEFPLWDQGGKIYDYSEYMEESPIPYFSVSISYDYPEEGRTAVERYCDSIIAQCWKYVEYGVYTKKIGDKTYTIDLEYWDQNGECYPTIRFYYGDVCL